MVLSPLHLHQNDDSYDTDPESDISIETEIFTLNYTKPYSSNNWGLIVEIYTGGSIIVDDILSGGIIDSYNKTSRNNLQIGDQIMSVNGLLVSMNHPKFQREMKKNLVRLRILRNSSDSTR